MTEIASLARYSRLQRILHWLTVLAVLTTIPAGLVMVQEGLPRPLQDGLYLYHKNIGPLILMLVLARLAARAAWPPPPLPVSVPPMQARIADTVHWLLYLCLLVMVISGFLRVQAGGFPMEIWDPLVGGLVAQDKAVEGVAKTIHHWVRVPLMLLILAHIGAAALHGLVNRDGVFSRMWPPV